MLMAIEPKYTGIPPGQLRRMGRALRMGVGAGMYLLEKNRADGLLVATANSGIEDSITFLKQILDYNEGRLTPTNFVQSTFNAIAGLMGMITKNTGYNATHVHRGLAFENALIDVQMLLTENPFHQYLVGGVDEISIRNHRMESLAGWYKTEPVSNSVLYQTTTSGSLPGEGAAMFIVNNQPENAAVKFTAIKTLHSADEAKVTEEFKKFLNQNGQDLDSIDLLLQGENGDSRFLHFYHSCEKLFGEVVGVARFKHAFGEGQTVSALALWLAMMAVKSGRLPDHYLKRQTSRPYQKVVIYNNYQGNQHSFMLIEKA